MKYREYKNVFLKAILDILFPYWEGVDHNIIFKEDNTLLFNLLYNISLDQLEMVKNYLKTTLIKVL